MKLLLAGDSFISDWTMKYPDKVGWPNMLAHIYDVTNIGQAGVSEYKILKQIESADLSIYDYIIISHTCFGRVHTLKHPTLYKDPIRENSDLILSDVLNKKEYNPGMKAAFDYFVYHWDEQYYRDIYDLIRDKIAYYLTDKKVININNFEPRDSDISYKHLLKDFFGDMNHFNEEGNARIFNDVLNYLRS